MSNEKLGFTEILSLISAAFLIISITYIFAFTQIVGHELMQYFTISDYVDVALPATIPYLITFFAAFFLAIIVDMLRYDLKNIRRGDNPASFKELKKLKIGLNRNQIIFLFWFGTIAFINVFTSAKSIANSLNAIFLTVTASFITTNRVAFKFPNPKYLFMVMIAPTLAVTIITANINGNEIDKLKENPGKQEIVLEDESTIIGTVIFSLKDHIIFYNSMTSKQEIYSWDKVKTIRLGNGL